MTMTLDTYGPEFGYTLATRRLFCDFALFQEWASDLVQRPLMTHDFADAAVWEEVCAAFEEHISDRARVAREDHDEAVHLYGSERVAELEREANK